MGDAAQSTGGPEFLFVAEDEVMDTVENMALQFPVYDALYAYCRADRA
ncbi:MAG TPA: hypothetical protein VFX87_02160 [Methylomirabilota bacterium]|nr:hypothetical protein [Methylomirabilota bacterium]